MKSAFAKCFEKLNFQSIKMVGLSYTRYDNEIQVFSFLHFSISLKLHCGDGNDELLFIVKKNNKEKKHTQSSFNFVMWCEISRTRIKKKK